MELKISSAKWRPFCLGLNEVNVYLKDSFSFQTTEAFLEEYARQGLSMPRSPYAQVAYDTVWTMALTISKAR